MKRRQLVVSTAAIVSLPVTAAISQLQKRAPQSGLVLLVKAQAKADKAMLDRVAKALNPK